MMRKFLCALVIALFSLPAFAAENEDAEVSSELSGEGVVSEEKLMRDAAEKYRSREKLKRELDNEALFEQQLDNEYNITPQQIEKARKRRNAIEKAAQLPVPARGVTRSQVVSLEPGAKNGVIRCYPQYVSTIRILDTRGNPWPIMAHMVGNSEQFQIQKPDMEPYDTIMVSPLVNTGSTNLTLMLDNNDGEDPVPPLSLQLIVSPNYQENYDTVASIRVNRRGPRAANPIMDGDAGKFNTDEIMLSFLDGTPPKEALRLKTSSKAIDAWTYDDMLYVRSKKKIIWPAWNKQITSGEKNDVTFAYELPMVPSVMFSGNSQVEISKYPAAVERAMQGK